MADHWHSKHWHHRINGLDKQKNPVLIGSMLYWLALCWLCTITDKAFHTAGTIFTRADVDSHLLTPWMFLRRSRSLGVQVYDMKMELKDKCEAKLNLIIKGGFPQWNSRAARRWADLGRLSFPQFWERRRSLWSRSGDWSAPWEIHHPIIIFLTAFRWKHSASFSGSRSFSDSDIYWCVVPQICFTWRVRILKCVQTSIRADNQHRTSQQSNVSLVFDVLHINSDRLQGHRCDRQTFIHSFSFIFSICSSSSL